MVDICCFFNVIINSFHSKNLTNLEKDPDIENIHNGKFFIEFNKNNEYK